jgi:hypothetical protein
MSSTYGNGPTTVLDHFRVKFGFLLHPENTWPQQKGSISTDCRARSSRLCGRFCAGPDEWRRPFAGSCEGSDQAPSAYIDRPALPCQVGESLTVAFMVSISAPALLSPELKPSDLQSGTGGGRVQPLSRLPRPAVSWDNVPNLGARAAVELKRPFAPRRRCPPFWRPA